jgi:hypothetical protein
MANDAHHVALLMQQSRHRDLLKFILQAGKKGKWKEAELSNNSDLSAYQDLAEEFNDSSVVLSMGLRGLSGGDTGLQNHGSK